MPPGADLKAQEYGRRYAVAQVALDSAEMASATLRLVAQQRAPDGASAGLIVAGATRLRAARRVGLLAAAMNPLTRAHLALAESARRAARLDTLCWVATAVTIDKESVERATLADRLLQTRALTYTTHDGLLLLPGGLYVEQARAARALLAPTVELTLIVGFDKILQIFDPHYYADRDAALTELFAEAEMLVAPRAGNGATELRALLDRPENRRYSSRVSYCPLPPRYQRDSSTAARAAAAVDGANDLSDLRKLLAPEGLALAQITRAYEPARAPGPSDLGDAYSARQKLLAALADLPLAALLPAEQAKIPTLRTLVARSAQRGARGEALRAWVGEPAPHTLAGLRAALTAWAQP